MTHPWRSYEEALNLSEQDNLTMAAPNAQPAKRGGMKAPNTHAPHAGAGHGSSEGQGGAVKRTDPSSKAKSPKNKNRLH